MPEKISVLCAAALLHDITKEWRDEEHVEFLASHGVSLSECELLSPKTFHARSAALVISEKYPELADDLPVIRQSVKDAIKQPFAVTQQAK